MREKIKTRKRKKETVSKNHLFEIAFINDSGAGRCVFSEKVLKDQGVDPKSVKESRNPRVSDTGGGEVDAVESLQIVSSMFGS